VNGEDLLIGIMKTWRTASDIGTGSIRTDAIWSVYTSSKTYDKEIIYPHPRNTDAISKDSHAAWL